MVLTGEVSAPPPSTEAMDQVSPERAEIYRCMPPEGLCPPLLVQPADIEDFVPTKSDIVVVVQGLKGVRSGAL